MKTALTVWNELISPVFDAARMLMIVEIENKKIINRHDEPLDPGFPSRTAQRLCELDVGTLICGAISEIPARLIEAKGIEIIPFITGRADDILDLHVKGQQITPAFLMPGCHHHINMNRCARKGTRRNSGFKQQKGDNTMPGRDGRGPQGLGPKSGRGRGGCRTGRKGRISDTTLKKGNRPVGSGGSTRTGGQRRAIQNNQ